MSDADQQSPHTTGPNPPPHTVRIAQAPAPPPHVVYVQKQDSFMGKVVVTVVLYFIEKRGRKPLPSGTRRKPALLSFVGNYRMFCYNVAHEC